MKSLQILTITTTGLLFSTLATATPRPGIRIELHDAGLAIVAETIKDQMAAEPIEDMPLGPVSDRLPGGVDIAVEDARLNATVADVGMTSHPNKLQVVVDLERVRINLPVMQVSKRILGRNVEATCYGAAIHWGNRGPVSLVVEIAAEVAAKRLNLTPGALQHRVTSEDYGVVSPDRCDAPVGMGEIMRLAAVTGLEGARSMIEPTLRRRFEGMLPELSATATTALSPSFPFSISGVPGLPSRNALFGLFPLSVQLTAGRMALVGGVDVAVAERLAPPAAVPPMPIAGFGINPTIITDAFATLFPDGTDFVEIGEDTAPGLRDVLDVRSAASIWPDLQHLQLSKPYLKLWLRIAAAPQLATDSATQSVRADIPRIEMKFQIEQNGGWRDYFLMNVGVQTGVTARIAQETMSLMLAPDSRVTVNGRWADGYVPQIDVFEQDVAAFLFSTVFDYLGAAGPLTSIWVPTLVAGGRDVTLANPHVEGEFLNLDVVDVTPEP